MRILVIGSGSYRPAALEALREYVEQTLEGSAEVLAAHAESLVFSLSPNAYDIHDPRSGTDLKKMDKVVVRDANMRAIYEYSYYISRFCHLNGVGLWNDYSPYYPGTKFAQATVFYERSLPFPKTLFSGDSQALIALADKELGYPFVLKANSGSLGRSNYLVGSAVEAKRVVTKEKEVGFIAQEYCPNDRDYRLLFVGDEYLVFERRARKGKYVNNTSQGAAATLAPGAVPAGLVAQARDLSQALGLQVSGVDVVPRLGTDDWYFLEVNSQPHLRTGAFLKEKQQLLRRFLAGKPE